MCTPNRRQNLENLLWLALAWNYNRNVVIVTYSYSRFKIIICLQHCMKSAQIRNFFWSVFSCIWTEYGGLQSKSPYSIRIQENTDQRNLRIWTLFMQCKIIITTSFILIRKKDFPSHNSFSSFKTSSRLPQHVFKTSWRTKNVYILKDKKLLRWSRLQDHLENSQYLLGLGSDVESGLCNQIRKIVRF